MMSSIECSGASGRNSAARRRERAETACTPTIGCPARASATPSGVPARPMPITPTASRGACCSAPVMGASLPPPGQVAPCEITTSPSVPGTSTRLMPRSPDGPRGRRSRRADQSVLGMCPTVGTHSEMPPPGRQASRPPSIPRTSQPGEHVESDPPPDQQHDHPADPAAGRRVGQRGGVAIADGRRDDTSTNVTSARPTTTYPARKRSARSSPRTAAVGRGGAGRRARPAHQRRPPQTRGGSRRTGTTTGCRRAG